MKQQVSSKNIASKNKEASDNLIINITWGVATILALVMVVLLLRKAGIFNSVSNSNPVAAVVAPSQDYIPNNSSAEAALPAYAPSRGMNAVARLANPHTVVPSRNRSDVTEYDVEKGDSVFSIANRFKIKPETVLWANYDLLDDNPNMVSVGQKLTIPPEDGVYYKWAKNDTLEDVATRFSVDVEDILLWPANKLDLSAPEIEEGTYIMVPGGKREFRQWLVPTVWRAKAGANKTIAGPGACDLPDGGALGSGTFVFPTSNHSVSGNDYWSGHLGIDLAAADGAPVYAADSGMVVYAGSIGGGYGNMIMIDHGNGYHTLYAHLSEINTYCGASVGKGSLIGLAGSTGNSTGPHLHFEVRLNGGFINPHYVLN